MAESGYKYGIVWTGQLAIDRLVCNLEIFKRPGPAAGRALLRYAILSAILGVETVNLFGFSTVTTETYRYLFMGMAVMIVNREQRTENRELGKTCHLLLIVYCLLFS